MNYPWFFNTPPMSLASAAELRVLACPGRCLRPNCFPKSMERTWIITYMTAESLLLSIAMAAAAGLVGCFAVMRRMALAADALSHVALPGIGMAMALHINPVFGAVSMLFFGGLLVWAVEGKTRVGTETVIGVLFSIALAVGSMTTSGEDLIEALFGG